MEMGSFSAEEKGTGNIRIVFLHICRDKQNCILVIFSRSSNVCSEKTIYSASLTFFCSRIKKTQGLKLTLIHLTNNNNNNKIK